jgi:hypothetical protein
MAAPNIVNVADIKGNIAFQSLTNTNDNALISNASGSNTVLKVNNIFVSNVNGVSAATITLSYRSSANAVTNGTLATASSGTAYRIAYQISVPANTTLMLLDKAGSIYVPENASLSIQAGTAGYLEVVASFETIA